MKSIFPLKLNPGDEVRVVAPSSSLRIVSKTNQRLATKKLQALGLKVTFGKYVDEIDVFGSSSITSRIHDLHVAFNDKNVRMILAVIGGYSVNQILDSLDYDLIRNNPKILCGFSDTTALTNAIYAKTGLVTYSGPSFAMFAMNQGSEYTVDHFKSCVFDSKPFAVTPSDRWSDDRWWKNQQRRTFVRNAGPWAIQPGSAIGTIIGGNLCTLNLLHGTPYMPPLNNTMIFIEDDALVEGNDFAREFDRNLQSLIHQPGFDGVRAIVFGRFQKKSKMIKEKLRFIVKTKQALARLPIIADIDFGHTSPLITFPIGGTAKLRADASSVQIDIIKH